MKTLKFRNTYINLNNCKAYKAGASFNASTGFIDVGIRADDLKLHISINPGDTEEKTKQIVKKVSGEIKSYLDSFIKNKTEYIDLDEYVMRFLRLEKLI